MGGRAGWPDWPVGGLASWPDWSVGPLVFGAFAGLALWWIDRADLSSISCTSNALIWDCCSTATLMLKFDLVAFSGRTLFANTVIELQSLSTV